MFNLILISTYWIHKTSISVRIKIICSVLDNINSLIKIKTYLEYALQRITSSRMCMFTRRSKNEMLSEYALRRIIPFRMCMFIQWFSNENIFSNVYVYSVIENENVSSDCSGKWYYLECIRLFCDRKMKISTMIEKWYLICFCYEHINNFLVNLVI